MSITKDEISPELNSWDAIRSDFEGASLLVGNGASCAVWESFNYRSLFKVATSGNGQQTLTPEDRALFKSEDDTTNFEAVLSNLAITQAVCQTLGVPSSFVEERYSSIQQSLIAAVHAVHVPYADVDASPEVLTRIWAALWEYPRVYSSNYDLLLYWAIMSGPDDARHRDYFFDRETARFDVTNTGLVDGARSILYLHGGLHLVRLPWGGTRKLRWSSDGALLDKFGQELNVGESPLVVTEGTAGNKLKSIYASDYLRFAYDRLIRDDRPLVVFGHSLSASDDHLITAIKEHESRPIAISLMMRTERQIQERKAHYLKALSPIIPIFFDASTHPLGHLALRVLAAEGSEL